MLTKDQAGSVDWALLDDVKYGTGTKAQLPDGRPIIAKTGTTNNAQSAFFIGAIPQYTLAVGIFTANQSDHTTQTLNNLGGGGDAAGFGGYWPALIWHNFAEAEFLNLPVEQFPVPAVFPGSKWVQVEKIPGKKHKKHKGHGPVVGPSPPPTGPARAIPQPVLLVRLLPAVPEPESDPAQPITFADPGPELLVRPVLRRLPAPRRWRHRRRRPGRGQTAVPGAHTLAVAGFMLDASGPAGHRDQAGPAAVQASWRAGPLT